MTGAPPAPPWSWSGKGEATSDEELAEAEELAYGLWLDIGETRRSSEGGEAVGRMAVNRLLRDASTIAVMFFQMAADMRPNREEVDHE